MRWTEIPAPLPGSALPPAVGTRSGSRVPSSRPVPDDEPGRGHFYFALTHGMQR